MNALRQRIADWLRERRIVRLRAKAARIIETTGRASNAREEIAALLAECNRRSPEQVARMERARGLAHG